MKINVNSCVYNPDKVTYDQPVSISSPLLKENRSDLNCKDLIAYPPFINSHDHLISNWYPKASESQPYKNVNLWVVGMKATPSFIERNKVWINDGSFDLTLGTAPLIVKLGIFKNMFSGCAVVQDHIRKQKHEYYQGNPITILEDYTQCHSVSMGNWWGGKTAVEEWFDAHGKMPFVIHLAEGTDDSARTCFPKIARMNLLQPNTLLVHAIALNKTDLKRCADEGTSICWCPESNLFLIGETLDIYTCMELGINVVIGTDSPMSGSTNMLAELQFAHEHFPDIPMNEMFRMITTNAAKALFLPEGTATLSNDNQDILLINKYNDDPFDNLLELNIDDIQFFMHKGIPVYGDSSFLKHFEINRDDYYFFDTNSENKFALGRPDKIIAEIDKLLGYHKDFPFIPF